MTNPDPLLTDLDRIPDEQKGLRRLLAERYRPAFNYRLGSDFVALKPVVEEPEDSVRAGNGR